MFLKAKSPQLFQHQLEWLLRGTDADVAKHFIYTVAYIFGIVENMYAHGQKCLPSFQYFSFLAPVRETKQKNMKKVKSKIS